MTAALRIVPSPSGEPVLQDLDDDALMLLAVGDHRAAFTMLITRHEQPVRRYLARMVGDEASDLAQEVFLRVWMARARYRREGRFTVFLYRVARNLAFSHLRWRKLRTFVDGTSPPPREASTEEVGLARLLRREEGAALNLVLQDLKPTLREVLVLRHAEGLDYETISAIVGISEENARARAHRGLAWLRQRLARSGR
jgi:RNA polymerase sigma-70 factor (ECF subfamily)